MVKIKLKMTPRERTLLGVLLTLVLAVLIYYFVWIPQEEKKLALTEGEVEYQDKIDYNNLILGKELEIDKEYEELKREEREISSKYIKELNQAQLIKRLNELLTKNNIEFPDFSFTEPTKENIGEVDVNKMSASMPFEGTYQGLIETMIALNKNPQKILIERVSVNGNDGHQGEVSGSMSLKFYSLDGILAKEFLEGEGIEEVLGQSADIVDSQAPGSVEPEQGEEPTSTKGKVPFIPFQSYRDRKSIEEEAEAEEDIQVEDLKPFIETTIISFDKGNFYFLPSHDFVKGNVYYSNRAKSGKSLRFEYDITAIEEENRAYIDTSKNSVELNFPPDSLGIWVYSYDYQPITLGVEFKGQLGERKEVPFTEGLDWTGWKYLSLSPPSEVAYYPCSIERLYVDMPRGRDGKGVLLLDNLETLYTRNMDEDGLDLSIKPYVSYVVEYGDTFKSISFKNYGSERYADEISYLNEMSSDDQLQPGRVIILKRR